MSWPVLLTGFEPFGGETVNPSWELVRELAAEPSPHVQLTMAATCLPVDRSRLARDLAAALDRHRPAVVLAVGQATGRATIQLERQAINLLDTTSLPDNGGHVVAGEALHDQGPRLLSATLPVVELSATLRGAGHPIQVSEDAGRYLCNALLYELLHIHGGLASAFVHIPLLPEQAAHRGLGEASMDPCLTRDCLRDLLRLLPPLLERRPLGPVVDV